MFDLNNHPVLVVMAIGVAAPLLAEIPKGFRVPTVVLEMALGIVVGPHVLGLVKVGGLLGWMGGTLGLGALFFMAGMELDLDHVRGRPLSLKGYSWLLSFALGLAAAGLLYVLKLVQSPLMVAVALTTTAIGTLPPILRDDGELETEFGRLILAAGAMGEFGPIVIASVAFTAGHAPWTQVGFMAALVAITFLVALIALRVRSPRIVELLGRTLHSSTQLPVRVSMLLQSTKTILMIPLFLALFFVVRGTPVLCYRSHLARGERLSFALYVSTALPMVVAITHIGVETGRMQGDIAAALVGAAIVSVLLFPAIAGGLRATNSLRTSQGDTAQSE